MGVLQNQFNSALTGLTFLAQQTPGWQYRKEKASARMGLRDLQKGRDDANARAKENTDATFNKPIEERDMTEEISALDAWDAVGDKFDEDIENFIETNKMYLPNDYADIQLRKAQGEMEYDERIQSAQAMSTAQESAQARQTEINTIDSNMKNYVEMIREMKANGIIKSNRQAKRMIYKAEHQEDKK